MQAYANPATAVITVTGPAGTGLKVFNRLGQAVKTGEIPLTQQSEVDLSGLPDGVYVLREQTTGTTVRVAKVAGRLAYQQEEKCWKLWFKHTLDLAALQMRCKIKKALSKAYRVFLCY
nr:T9SS type A sorting domain-containing protein [Hymenobacter terricola]